MERCRDLIEQAITNGTHYTLDVELLESLRRQYARRFAAAGGGGGGGAARASSSQTGLKTDDGPLLRAPPGRRPQTAAPAEVGITTRSREW